MIQILIVDDEKPICDLIQMSLTRAGYHCTCVYDGLAAADILERNVFDLILLDVMLPNADGFELMEYIRPLGIPVIFLTARGSVDDRVRGLRMGAEDYIVKPFEVVELLDEAPEPPAGSGVTSIVHTGNGRHYLMLGATADGTTVQLAFDVTETYTVRQTQQRAYHTTFLILVAFGAAVAWVTSYLLTRPLGTLSRASRELARGNLSYRAPVRSHDEVGQLAADFNRMAGQLEQNVKRIQESMALQERFMADFSHEMKTPMTSIIGYADLLRSQVLTPDEQMDAANYIFSEGKRLEALGLKLLDMLSLDQSKLQLVPAHPADLVAGLLEHLKRLYAQKGIALQYRTEEGACFLEPDLFKTLLVNLMDNARKALDSGGNIYVWQEMLPDGCRVRVLDNGRGIPPEALAHLTEAFYRVDKSRSRAQGGAGLGLSLCNEIVQLHGGTMQFESRVGNGTVVTVELKGGRV